jgi:hypothetical protein
MDKKEFVTALRKMADEAEGGREFKFSRIVYGQPIIKDGIIVDGIYLGFSFVIHSVREFPDNPALLEKLKSDE